MTYSTNIKHKKRYLISLLLIYCALNVSEFLLLNFIGASDFQQKYLRRFIHKSFIKNCALPLLINSAAAAVAMASSAFSLTLD